MRARVEFGLGALFIVTASAATAAAQSVPGRTPAVPPSTSVRAGIKSNTAGTHVEKKDDGAPVEKATKAPARLPWRGTGLSWDHSATTSLVGIGRDVQSVAHEQYVQTFSAALSYFVIDQEKWSVALGVSPSFSVEVTNSGDTTTRNEPWLNDLPVSAVYRRKLYVNEEKELYTGMSLNGTVILPASPASYSAGTFLTTSPRLAVFQTVPIFGQSAKHFQSVTIGASVRWDHRFGKADIAVNEDLNMPRMDARGSTFLSDALSFNRFADNSLRQGVFVFLSEDIVGTTLQFFGSMGLNQNFLPNLPDSACDVQLQTGCADVKTQGTFTQYGYGFAGGFTWFPTAELGLYLNYANGGGQLGPNGERRSVFYNPNAQFSVGLALGVDAIFEALTGPRRKDPFFLVAKNDEKKRLDKKLPSAF